jgi:TPR repeat protein
MGNCVSVLPRYLPLMAFAILYQKQHAGERPMITSFTNASIYGVMLTRKNLLRVVSCGFKDKLVRLLSLCVGHHFVSQNNTRAYEQMVYIIARRVASKEMAVVRDEAAKEAEELCASGQCAAAFALLQLAIELGHLPSRAHMAWLLINGRKGVVKDPRKGFELAEEGVRLDCSECKGVVAECYKGDFCSCSIVPGLVVNEKLSLQLARDSSDKDSRYGKIVWGKFCLFGGAQQKEDIPKALELLTSAAAQGLEEALICLGCMYQWGIGVLPNCEEALRFYQLAVDKENPEAMCRIASCHENGVGVAADVVVAILWYRLAQDAGYPNAARALLRLKA